MNTLYRILLWLYPASFRREYGDEMRAIFSDRVAGAGAGRKFGLILDAVSEAVPNAVAMQWQMLRQDVRYSMRSLRRAPAFAFTAIFVTALGVGANTAAFSVADFVLLRPLGFPDPESLVRLCEGPRTGPVGWGCMNQISPANFRDFKQQTSSFQSLGAYRRDAVNLVGGGEPRRLNSAAITSDVMPLLGVQPLLGSMVDSSRQRGERLAILSFGLWQSLFGGVPDVVGKTVNLDGAPHVVAGVMPEHFYFPNRDTQLWTSMEFVEEDYANRGNNYLEAVGRLAPGVSFEQARADLDVVAERLARDFPQTNAETGVSFFRMREEFSPRFRMMIQGLVGASLCILILACANLGNLLLVRAGARERELAVRWALGAGKERLVRQMLTESITLAVLGGAAGILVSLLIFPLLSLMVPDTLPIGSTPSLNLQVLAVAALFTALTGLGFGVIPAIRASGKAAFGSLRSGRAGSIRRGFRSVLVAVEVTATVVLLVSSGLLIRAMLRIQSTDPGFRAEGVLTARTALPKPKYGTVERREQFYRDVLTQVRNIPGVTAAAFTSGLPMVMTGGIATVVLPGQEVRPDGDYLASRRYVTPQFFKSLGISLIAGRDLEEADAGRRVAVVSESFVKRYWPDGDALGKVFIFRDSLTTVVGVVRDIMVRGLERSSEPQMYLPSSIVPEGPLIVYDPKDLVVRTTGNPSSVLPAIREIVRQVDPDQPISDVLTLPDLLSRQTATRASQVRVLGALAVVALLLAGLGIHGLLSYTVSQRRQEIAVRMALGAQPARIARGVLWDALSVVMLGLIPGVFIAYLSGKSMSALLSGVQPDDLPTIATAMGLCLVMAVTGAMIPALRAVGVDPMSVMRTE